MGLRDYVVGVCVGYEGKGEGGAGPKGGEIVVVLLTRGCLGWMSRVFFWILEYILDSVSAYQISNFNFLEMRIDCIRRYLRLMAIDIGRLFLEVNL